MNWRNRARESVLHEHHKRLDSIPMRDDLREALDNSPMLDIDVITEANDFLGDAPLRAAWGAGQSIVMVTFIGLVIVEFGWMGPKVWQSPVMGTTLETTTNKVIFRLNGSKVRLNASPDEVDAISAGWFALDGRTW